MKHELSQSFSLVYDSYVDCGLIEPNVLQARVIAQHALPTSEVIVATVRSDVFATATLVRDDYLGLPMESVYSAEVQRLRDQGFRLAEVSCLADRRCDVSRSLIKDLMAFIAQCAEDREVDQLLIAVHPRHAKFYSRFLGFEEFGGLQKYKAVKGNPAIALTLDLNSLEHRSPSAYQRLFGKLYCSEQLEHRPTSIEGRHYIQWLLASSDLYDTPVEYQAAARAS